MLLSDFTTRLARACRLWLCGASVFFGLTTLVLTTPLASAAPRVAQADTPQFALQPVYYDPSEPATQSYFIFDAKLGQVLKNQVRVTNVGDVAGTASLYSVDATTGQTSGTVYLGQSLPRTDVGSWLNLGAQTVTLQPGQSQVVPFTLAIPTSVRDGQHVGGIVAAAESTPAQSSSTIQVNVQQLTIVGVLVNLPGTPVEQLQASGFTPGGQDGYQTLSIGLTNSGTMLLKPAGSLEVRDSSGAVVKQFSLKMDSFLPQTTISYPVNISGKALSEGTYSATLTLHYGDPQQTLTYTEQFSVTAQQLQEVFGSQQTTAPGSGSVLLGLDRSLVIEVGGRALLLVVCLIIIVLLLRRRARRRNNDYDDNDFRRFARYDHW